MWEDTHIPGEYPLSDGAIMFMVDDLGISLGKYLFLIPIYLYCVWFIENEIITWSPMSVK